MTRKSSSTTALQALEPHNFMRRHLFWNSPLHLGVAGCPVNDVIDTDEAGIYLPTCKRNFGKAFVGVPVRESGPYGYNLKFTLIMSICSNGWKHATFREVAGTSGEDFLNYTNVVIARLAILGIRKVFLWDNLRSDVVVAIYVADHRICAQPAYYPEDGPIEFILIK